MRIGDFLTQNLSAQQRGSKLGMAIYANPDYYPPTVNAIEILARNYDLTVISRNQDPPDRVYPGNVTVHRLGEYSSVRAREVKSMAAKLGEYTNFVREFAKLLGDCAVVYVYDPFSFVAANLVKTWTQAVFAIVYHPHETADTTFALTSLSGWIQKYERAWLDRAWLFVFPDADRIALFEKFVKLPSQPDIVPNFPLQAYFDFDLDWDELIDRRWQRLVLFYRGTISDTSAMQEIIRATQLISPAATVEFVGFLNEANTRILETCVRETIGTERFKYLGMLPYGDLQPHTLAATIGFALYKNTSGDRVACATACNKIYEYAACGLPTIVSDFPTYRHYLAGESWVYFADPEDPHSIAAAITEILSDRDRYRQICRAARTAFVEKFNYETVFSPIVAKIQAAIANQ